MRKEGFDVRIVSYEHIHSIDSKDEKAMLDAINPRPNQKILDAFCGYGAVGKNCLLRESNINLYLDDESEVQIKRARENLPQIPKNHFSTESFPKSHFENNFFDTIVIKMGLHEVRKDEQLKVLKDFLRILKPEGKVIVWDIMLNKNNQTLFQDIIRKKDELAGFDMLIKERYFFREEEFLDNVIRAGFTKIKDFHTINYRFSSRKRLESELKNDMNLLKKLNDYIRKRFPEQLRETLKYSDLGEDVRFNVIKKIYIINK